MGELLVPNKLTHKTLLMIEKELGKKNITYLVEELLPLEAATEAYLKANDANVIQFSVATSSPLSLRSAIMEHIKKGRHVLFIPGPVPHVKGVINHIPPRIYRKLEALHISPVPVFVGFYNQTVFDAEANTDENSEIQLHFKPK